MTDTEYRPVTFRYRRLAPEEQVRRSSEFLETMRLRRTIRAFSAEPVPFDLIERAIRAAGTAPSGANQQPWTFVVVTEPEIRQRIRAEAEVEEREFYESNSAEWQSALAHLGTDWRKEHLTTAPYLIVVFAQSYGRIVDPATGMVRKVKHYYVQESVGIAVGFLLASLTHAGLFTLTHTPSPMGFLGKILGRPENERPYVVIPVGYPSDGCTVPSITKKSLDQILVRVEVA